MRRLALVLGVIFSANLHAAQSTTEEVKTDVVETPTSGQNSSVELSFTTAKKANSWGLKADEWKRYETIMEGPRGYWSPGLDPLTALGVEAKTDAERMRYATLQVIAEFNRVEGELAYQRAYNQAFKKQFPDSVLIGEAQPKQPDFLKHQLPASGLQEVPVTLFVSLNCALCDATVSKAVASQKRVDVYVIGAEGDDAIRKWAANVGIQPQQVQRRQITLNHNKDELKLVTGKATVKPEQLPLAFKRVGQAWQKIDI